MDYNDPMFMEEDEKKIWFEKKLNRFCKITSVFYYIYGLPIRLVVFLSPLGLIRLEELPAYIPDFVMLLYPFAWLIFVLGLPYSVPCIVASLTAKSMTSYFFWENPRKGYNSIFRGIFLGLSGVMLIVKWVAMLGSFIAFVSKGRPVLVVVITQLSYCAILLIMLFLLIPYHRCRKKDQHINRNERKDWIIITAKWFSIVTTWCYSIFSVALSYMTCYWLRLNLLGDVIRSGGYWFVIYGLCLFLHMVPCIAAAMVTKRMVPHFLTENSSQDCKYSFRRAFLILSGIILALKWVTMMGAIEVSILGASMGIFVWITILLDCIILIAMLFLWIVYAQRRAERK